MTSLILQARLDSTRLPGKALLSLGSEPLLLCVMRTLRTVSADAFILACPADCAGEFAPLAELAGFRLVVGSKDDVLERYCDAIRASGADRVIRATGDNPFAFPDAADEIAREAAELGADYAAFAGLPYGAGVESVAAEALLRAEREARLPAEREHVCPYLYGNPDRFTLHRPLAPARWRGEDCRVTIDTSEDLDRANALWAALGGSVRGSGGDGTSGTGARVIAAYRALFPAAAAPR